MERYPWLTKKQINYDYLVEALSNSTRTNQFSNFGPANNLLENIARKKLKISDDYDIIACSSGTGALHAIIHTFQTIKETHLRTANQAFTFPSNGQGPCQGSIFVDFDNEFNFDLADKHLEHANIIIVTNVFGHLQNLTKMVKQKLIISFWYLIMPQLHIVFTKERTLVIYLTHRLSVYIIQNPLDLVKEV